MTDTLEPSPLAGVRVLDISEGVAGPFCAKLLGDLGADVVKVERPGTGDETRATGPFPAWANGADIAAETRRETSAAFFYLNTSKRSVVLDTGTADGRDQFGRLLRRFDVVVAGETAESLDRRGLGFDTLRRWNPEAILTTVSGFGSFGPHSHYQSSHLVACAVGGWCQCCGLPEREPLQVGGALSETLAGAFAAAATHLAVLGRSRHGGGDHVDVSVQQAVFTGAQIPTLLYEYLGVVPERRSSVGAGTGGGYVLPTADGHIGLQALTRPQWQGLCELLGRGDIAEDERYATVSWTAPDERVEEIRAAFQAAVTDRTADDVFHEAATRRVPVGLIPDMAGLFDLAPHRHRDFIVPLEHPVAGTVAVPGVPFLATGTAPRPSRPPLLGEHTEVIKVESIQRIDGWRGSASADADAELPGWERSPYFNWINRNKRDVTLDLTDPRGAEIVRTMVRDADVLIENYTPRVMARFGLSYETLRAINPRLVMISLSGFGADSPWRDYVAFGMSTEQMAGFTHLTGYAGGEPLFTGTTGGDLFAGVMGANALFAALHHRDRTGEGQHIDLSQIEACSLYVGDAMTAWSLAGADPGRVGNDHHHYPLQGVYPCRGGRWVAITCKNEAHRAALAAVVGDDAIATGADCHAAIAAWTGPRDHRALMAELQAAGIPAGAVQNGPELLADAQLAARGGLLLQDRPGLGPRHYPAQPYRFRRAEPPPNTRAPLLGEHSREVLREHAGLTDDDIAELVIDDVVGTVPIAAR